MADAARRTALQAAEMGPVAPSSSQTARYTQELIDSLRKIAKGQKEELLALLLEAASIEAGRIAGRRR